MEKEAEADNQKDGVTMYIRMDGPQSYDAERCRERPRSVETQILCWL